MLARFGGDNGTILHFGTDDQKFLGIGCMVGYAIIVPAILGTYLMGATHTFLVSTYKSSILLLIKNKKYQNVFIVFFIILMSQKGKINHTKTFVFLVVKS